MSQRGPSNPYCDSGAAARMEHANPRSAFTSIFYTVTELMFLVTCVCLLAKLQVGPYMVKLLS